MSEHESRDPEACDGARSLVHSARAYRHSSERDVAKRPPSDRGGAIVAFAGVLIVSLIRVVGALIRHETFGVEASVALLAGALAIVALRLELR